MTTTTVVVEYPHRSDPRQIEAQWTVVECFPARGAAGGTAGSILPARLHVLGTGRVPLPNATIVMIGAEPAG